MDWSHVRQECECVSVCVCAPYLPFAVLSSPFQQDVPVLHVHLGTVSDAHGHRAEEVQTRGAVRHLWTQQDVTFVQFLDTKTQQRKCF